MKALLKIILIIGLCFATTFILVKSTGSLSVDQIETWLNQARELSPVYVGSIVFALLFADLFIAVPTLTVTILSGFFLGQWIGTAAAWSGLMTAGVCGYWLSRYFGEAILRFLVRDEDEREEAKATFRRHGFVMILLSRAVPILPEVTACLAGMTGMGFPRFLLAWLLSTAPYTLIAAYAGSISSVESPQPAIFAAIGISGFFWIAWYLFHRRNRRLESA